jgi:plastocyanin
MNGNAALMRRTGARLRAMLAAALVLGLLLSVSFAGTVQAATTLNVGVGVGSGTVSGNAYLPGDVTILVGDSVKWTIESDEPHSVTFGTGPAGTPPDEWPVTGLTGTVPPPPGTANLTGTYAGTGFLNTGLLFKG